MKTLTTIYRISIHIRLNGQLFASHHEFETEFNVTDEFEVISNELVKRIQDESKRVIKDRGVRIHNEDKVSTKLLQIEEV